MVGRADESSIKRAAQGHNPSWHTVEQDQSVYNRENKEGYPYKSHWQYARAWFGLLGCGSVAVFNGWQSFHPFSGGDFIAAYISVSQLLVRLSYAVMLIFQ